MASRRAYQPSTSGGPRGGSRQGARQPGETRPALEAHRRIKGTASSAPSHSESGESSTYRVTTNKGFIPGLSGNLYQLKLLMLVETLASKKSYQYLLATEIGGVGAFDDIAFKRTDTKEMFFLQAKHSTSELKGITSSYFAQNSKKKFSLRKYFISYLQCRRYAETNDLSVGCVVLCTNMDLKFEEGTKTLVGKCSKNSEKLVIQFEDVNPNSFTQDLILIGEKEKIYKLKTDDLDISPPKKMKPDKTVKYIYPYGILGFTNDIINLEDETNVKECDQTGELLLWLKRNTGSLVSLKKDFLKHLVFVVNYLDERKLSEKIYRDLHSSEFEYQVFLNEMLKWLATFCSQTNTLEFRKPASFKAFKRRAEQMISREVVKHQSRSYRQDLIKSGISFKKQTKPFFYPGAWVKSSQHCVAVALILAQTLDLEKTTFMRFKDFQRYWETIKLAIGCTSDDTGYGTDNELLVLVQDDDTDIKSVTSKVESLLTEKVLLQVLILRRPGPEDMLDQNVQLLSMLHLNEDPKADAVPLSKLELTADDLSDVSVTHMLEQTVLFQGEEVLLSSLMSETNFRELVDMEVVETFIKGAPLTIGEPLKELRDQEQYCERKLDGHSAELITPMPEDDVLSKLWDKPMIVVQDEPGAGKSTLLTSLARKLKKQHPDHWVLVFKLELYCHQLREEIKRRSSPRDDGKWANNPKLCIEFLTKRETDGFNERLLDDAVGRTNKIVLFIDSFDEISPTYTKLMVDLLKGLAAGKVRTWIATRTYMRWSLEGLGDQLTWLSLTPLEHKEQIDYLAKKIARSGHPEEQHLAWSRIILSKLKEKCNIPSRGGNLYGKAQHLMMVAEVFLKNRLEKTLALDDYSLCQEFFDILFDRFMKKQKVDTAIPERAEEAREEKEKLIKYFEVVAAVVFIGRGNAAYEMINVDFSEAIKKKDKLCSVDVLLDDPSHDISMFVHRSYAEYFFSGFIYSLLQGDRENEIYHKIESFLFTQLYVKEEFQDVRRYLDSRLEVTPQHFNANRDEVAGCLHETHSFLLVSIIEGRQNLRKYLWAFSDRLNLGDWLEIYLLAVEYRCENMLQRILTYLNMPDATPEDVLRIMASKNAQIKSVCSGCQDFRTSTDVQDILTSLSNKTNQYAIVRQQALNRVQESGHEDLVLLLLRRSTYVMAETSSGPGVLRDVAMGSHTDVDQLMVKRGSDLTAVDTNAGIRVSAAQRVFPDDIDVLLERVMTTVNIKGRTALHHAVIGGLADDVQLLLERDSSVTAVDTHGHTALHYAAMKGHADKVQLLLMWGSSVTAVNTNGLTALHLAAMSGHVDVVRLLLEKNSSVTAVDTDEYSALHLAATKGNLEVVLLLLEWNSSVTVANTIGQTALHIAAMRGHVDAVRLLLEEGSSVMAQDTNGATALHIAAMGGHVDIVRLLLDKNSSVTAVNKNGRTALHVSAVSGPIDVARLLLEEGSSVTAQDTNGATALHIAAMGGQVDVVRLLLEEGSSVTAVVTTGCTALHIAAMGGHVDVVRLLLEEGSSVTAVNKNGRTALHVAKVSGREDVVRLLLEWGTAT